MNLAYRAWKDILPVRRSFLNQKLHSLWAQVAKGITLKRKHAQMRRKKPVCSNDDFKLGFICWRRGSGVFPLKDTVTLTCLIHRVIQSLRGLWIYLSIEYKSAPSLHTRNSTKAPHCPSLYTAWPGTEVFQGKPAQSASYVCWTEEKETDLELRLHDLGLVLVLDASVAHDKLVLRVQSGLHLGEPGEVLLDTGVELLQGVERVLQGLPPTLHPAKTHREGTWKCK